VGGDVLGDPGVAWGRVHLPDGGVGQQGPDDGMFAASGAQHKNLHSRTAYWRGFRRTQRPSPVTPSVAVVTHSLAGGYPPGSEWEDLTAVLAQS
jgi:hypothetical protein